MAGSESLTAIERQVAEWRNRMAARAARRARAATGFVSMPEPRSIGMHGRGRQLAHGHFQMAGQLVEAPGVVLWDLGIGDPEFWAEAHGFHWLDDLAASTEPAAQVRAREWTWGWIARFGDGSGPGWTPGLTGRRLVRWINHALMLLNGRGGEDAAFFAALSAQVRFLSRRWQAAPQGLPRFEALAGLICAGLSLTGMEGETAPALAALAAECAREIDAQGGIATRNPEELLEVFTLLTWVSQALTESGQPVPEPVGAAVKRIAPCLRTLRHADGGLARFHGGDKGLEGRLDHALAAAAIRAPAGPGPAMGFLRLHAGRTTLVVDAADPPAGAAGARAHASTLAFELTSGRRPLIVSCGPGASFGPVWRKAGRATVSHSTLSLDGYSSSRFGKGLDGAFVERAHVVVARPISYVEGHGLYLAHDGWTRTHGLTHGRLLTLSHDGRRLNGQDTLGPTTAEERATFAAALARRKGEPLRLSIRFHLHPEVDASLDMGGTAVSLALRSGEVWVFRPLDPVEMALEPSVYLERGRLQPRPAQQIVLTDTLAAEERLIGWTLAKAQDTPLAIRDLGQTDPAEA
jgi:uncharacterized heparinase superfamily protein